MRRATIVLLTNATLAVSFAATAPASAKPPRDDSLCVQWLYGEYLVHDAFGWHYQRQRLKCLRWQYVGHDVIINPFYYVGDPAPGITYGQFKALNPQPLPPRRRGRALQGSLTR